MRHQALAFAALAVLAAPALGQESIVINCGLPANAGLDECLQLPNGLEATNFLPAIAPAAALGALAVALATSATEATTGTTATTSTTD